MKRDRICIICPEYPSIIMYVIIVWRALRERIRIGIRNIRGR